MKNDNYLNKVSLKNLLVSIVELVRKWRAKRAEDDSDEGASGEGGSMGSEVINGPVSNFQPTKTRTKSPSKKKSDQKKLQKPAVHVNKNSFFPEVNSTLIKPYDNSDESAILEDVNNYRELEATQSQKVDNKL